MNDQEKNCKDRGHNFYFVDETSLQASAYPGAPTQISSLNEVYGGRYVRHIFCGKCGSYKNIELETNKELKPYIDLKKLKQ